MALVVTICVMIWTARRQMRAYVSIRPKLPLKVPAPDAWHSEGLIYEIVNDGLTPAYDVHHTLKVGVADLNEKAHPIEVSKTGSRLVLGHKGTSEIACRLSSPLTPEQITRLLKGELVILIFGEIRYRDAFSLRKGCSRYTRFSMKVVMKEISGSVQTAVQWAAEGNEAE